MLWRIPWNCEKEGIRALHTETVLAGDRDYFDVGEKHRMHNNPLPIYPIPFTDLTYRLITMSDNFGESTSVVQQCARSTQGRAIPDSRNEPLALACRGISSSTRSYTSPFAKQASLHTRCGFRGELQSCVCPQDVLSRH